mmetsp:Transcript_35905/g.40839  ORF Transcript_35905/g.40839 Transcript_35905/m.40839 type:complete len:127 (+) Transcript_35905:653-1033(+)
MQLTPQQRQGASGTPRLVIAVKHCDIISSGYPCATTKTESEFLHSPHVQQKKKKISPKNKKESNKQKKRRKNLTNPPSTTVPSRFCIFKCGIYHDFYIFPFPLAFVSCNRRETTGFVCVQQRVLGF